MSAPLTKRQHQILTFLREFEEREGYSPSLEEIAAGVGLRSLATVHVHLRNLEQKRRIRRGWNRSRSIEVLPERRPPQGRTGAAQVPLLGRVAAGAPIQAVNTPDTIDLPREFVDGEETFALQVRGESMIEEQIRDGDTIIVERRQAARNGETVVALIDEEDATVKKFFLQADGMVRLEPANAAMAPIVVEASRCRVQGVVVGLLRKY